MFQQTPLITENNVMGIPRVLVNSQLSVFTSVSLPVVISLGIVPFKGYYLHSILFQWRQEGDAGSGRET